MRPDSNDLRDCEHVEGDNSYVVDYAYLLRGNAGSIRVEWDRHIEGLFERGDWLRFLDDAGFESKVVAFDHSELEPGQYEIFVCTRRE